jgi:hypothetical protein
MRRHTWPLAFNLKAAKLSPSEFFKKSNYHCSLATSAMQSPSSVLTAEPMSFNTIASAMNLGTPAFGKDKLKFGDPIGRLWRLQCSSHA